MAEPASRLQPSEPGPFGAHWDGRGTHFAVFSAHADAMELCLFDHSGRHETARFRFPECTDGIWHGYLPGIRPGQLYGYRAYGPYEPDRGHRFNPHKLLLDPYARQLSGELRWHDALHGYKVGSPREDLSFDRRDSAAYMPKAVVSADHFDWAGDHPPRVPWSDTVIYEMHVRGFTKRRHDLFEHDRGTFGALGSSEVIQYLKGLGVTAVELLPIHAFARDRVLLEQKLTNYWGYNTLAFFAPDPQYLSDGTLGQVKWAVRQLHAAGIEVLLDVVFNHSCEGSERGATLSLRGLDNLSYYRLDPEQRRYCINDTGCGNTLDFRHPRVIQLTLDSLRYWVQEFHVDGFRFDLGVTLGRETHGFDPGAGFFDALMQDPVLSRVKLISEPWDIGPGGYQIGNHPAGMAEWNGRYRDDVRRYWRSDDGLRGALAARLQGSADLFDHHRRRPWASINFVTAHDGFTLHDLVSYEQKHNQANGEDNRDGGDDNLSRNWGVEGETDDAELIDLRDRLKRSFMATLLTSHGTPMLLAGDELGQTQNGNNNAYCQDNELSWLDWSKLDTERGRRMRDFTARLIALRKEWALLRAPRFMHGRGEAELGLPDLLWFDENGRQLVSADWSNPVARLLGVRRAQRSGERVDIAVLLFNADSADHAFELPLPVPEFRVLLDSNEPLRDPPSMSASSYLLAAHSVALISADVDRDTAQRWTVEQQKAADAAAAAANTADEPAPPA
ncbi:glycogen debranching protein GlgX [Panacagrimonas perspica]|uniref:glycogen debranching protein GlgX n=1 Tax=Panacagrimonas perspica TaxID=381431 RepID=UPI00105E60A7|nr:glycogen debranching protein GlgX [Panacagrimonas perspica]